MVLDLAFVLVVLSNATYNTVSRAEPFVTYIGLK
jgi:hypothetical protein